MDEAMRTFVFTSQSVQMCPPEQIFSRRVLNTFDRSKVSGKHENLMIRLLDIDHRLNPTSELMRLVMESFM
jgi:hypothetical protein